MVLQVAATGRDIGRRVHALRVELAFTQGQLATYAHVDRSWVSLLERGGIDDPSADRLRRVADALGTTIEYLLTGQQGREITIAGPEAKAGPLRRLSRLTGEQLEHLERLWRMVWLTPRPPDAQPQDERPGKGDGDEPGPGPERPA